MARGTNYSSAMGASSAVPEDRRAFLDEGGHAFLLVFGCEHRMENAAFEDDAFVQ